MGRPEQNFSVLYEAGYISLLCIEMAGPYLATPNFRGEFFNAFNHVQCADPATAYGAANFGYIQSTSVAPRILQQAAKIQF